MYYDVCIKQHVWLYVPYFTELLDIKEKNLLKYLSGKSEAFVKKILLIKHIIFYIHSIILSSFHVLVTLARNVLSIHIHSPRQ